MTSCGEGRQISSFETASYIPRRLILLDPLKLLTLDYHGHLFSLRLKSRLVKITCFALLNVQSLNNKSVLICNQITDSATDVMLLTSILPAQISFFIALLSLAITLLMLSGLVTLLKLVSTTVALLSFIATCLRLGLLRHQFVQRHSSF